MGFADDRRFETLGLLGDPKYEPGLGWGVIREAGVRCEDVDGIRIAVSTIKKKVQSGAYLGR